MRRYRGRNLNEALAQVKANLGEGALVLGNRRRRRYGLFGPKVVEVLALPGPEPGPRSDEGAEPPPVVDQAATGPGPAEQPAADGPGGLERSVRDLLVAGGVTAAVAGMLTERTLADGARLVGARQLVTSLAKAMTDLTGGVAPVAVWPGGKRVVAIIGPPGAGKTTALIKLACQLVLGGGYQVEVIGTDTARPGAADQLGRLCEILGVPFTLAYTPGELRRYCEASTANLVLVDTAGCAWREAEHLEGIGAVLEASSPAECLLALPATYEPVLASHLVAAVRPLGIDRLVLTHMDGIESAGAAVNLVCLARLPLAYFARGEEIPGELTVPCLEELADCVLAGRMPVAPTAEEVSPRERARA